MAQWTPSPPGRAFCMLPPRQCLPSQGRSIVESTPFSAWENFYVIIGSSAAALTGLQFVVVVLGAVARGLARRALARGGGCGGNRVHGRRHPAGAPADALRAGAGRLAVALRLSAHRVRHAAGGGARSRA